MIFRRPLLGVLLAAVAALPAAATGDPGRGKRVFAAQCSSCHGVKPGQTVLGPSLFGIVGRRSASVPNFAYSKAMKAASWTWTAGQLRTYLPSPKVVVLGTKMAYAGLKKPDQVEDLIAYLETVR
ncbi:c-type cytochrome [Phenylobacterium sp.]|uniref:c-type cytochrome n=1 Tax=Phenylobacterium sp. TaxID=1871053 RepID=UPI00286AD504|nr:c-type cytochrome [Phenylobacterium sp.]